MGDRRHSRSAGHGTLRFSQHAENERWQDSLTRDDVLDIIGLYTLSSKDLPDNALGRAPGINFERELHGGVWGLAKVDWNVRGFTSSSQCL